MSLSTIRGLIHFARLHQHLLHPFSTLQDLLHPFPSAKKMTRLSKLLTSSEPRQATPWEMSNKTPSTETRPQVMHHTLHNSCATNSNDLSSFVMLQDVPCQNINSAQSRCIVGQASNCGVTSRPVGTRSARRSTVFLRAMFCRTIATAVTTGVMCAGLFCNLNDVKM